MNDPRQPRLTKEDIIRHRAPTPKGLDKNGRVINPDVDWFWWLFALLAIGTFVYFVANSSPAPSC